jgi:uncharacterized membrane protein (DUF441 family)
MKSTIMILILILVLAVQRQSLMKILLKFGVVHGLTLITVGVIFPKKELITLMEHVKCLDS